MVNMEIVSVERRLKVSYYHFKTKLSTALTMSCVSFVGIKFYVLD